MLVMKNRLESSRERSACEWSDNSAWDVIYHFEKSHSTGCLIENFNMPLFSPLSKFRQELFSVTLDDWTCRSKKWSLRVSPSSSTSVYVKYSSRNNNSIGTHYWLRYGVVRCKQIGMNSLECSLLYLGIRNGAHERRLSRFRWCSKLCRSSTLFEESDIRTELITCVVVSLRSIGWDSLRNGPEAIGGITTLDSRFVEKRTGSGIYRWKHRVSLICQWTLTDSRPERDCRRTLVGVEKSGILIDLRGCLASTRLKSGFFKLIDKETQVSVYLSFI